MSAGGAAYSGDEARWWIAYPAGVEGPFTQGQLFEAARLGRLLPVTLVCEGQAGTWTPASVAMPGAFGVVAARPQAPVAPTPSADLGQRVDVGVSVVLAIITLGIWWLVWIYPRLGWYAERAGRPIGNRVVYFWIVVGSYGGAFVLGLLTFVLGIIAGIVAVVFASLLVYELSVDQRTLASTRGVTAMAAAPSTVVTLYAVGQGISLTLVLIPVSIVLSVLSFLYFFRNHNQAVSGEA